MLLKPRLCHFRVDPSAYSSAPEIMANNTRSSDWQHRPPYLPPAQLDKLDKEKSGRDAPFSKKIEGTCHCGRVRYWLSSDKPLASKYCHCSDCQTLHGAPFQWAAIFEKHDLAFEHGVQDLAFYDSGKKAAAHALPCKVSCANCGSRIMDEGRNMVLLFPALLKFKGDEQLKKNFAPQMHIFYPQRVLDITDGTPKWAGLNDKSEEVSETR